MASESVKIFAESNHALVLKGMRVFYFPTKSGGGNRIFLSDHQHTPQWISAIESLAQNKSCLEVGTMVNFHLIQDNKIIEVLWDCGTSIQYSSQDGGWMNLRVLDLGPTGYKSPTLMCDICYSPLLGVSFRCLSHTCCPDAETMYDLCYIHYSDNSHFVENHQFKSVLPNDQMGDDLPLRNGSPQYRLVGLFAGATVSPLSTVFEALGKITRLVHKGGHNEVFEAQYCNCVAEVIWNDAEECNKRTLEYYNVGTSGEVELKSVLPASPNGCIYATHFPRFDERIIDGAYKFHKSSFKMKTGDPYVIIEGSRPGLSIHHTTCLTQIDEEEEIWLKCRERKIQRLHFFYNNLQHLPKKQIHQLANTLQCASLPFNKFYEIPSAIFDCRKLKNLTMMSNHIMSVPKKVCQLKCLTNLHMSSNKIHFLPDVFNHLQELQFVSFNDNLLSILPPSFKCLTKLKRLDISKNLFKHIPPALYQLPELRVLRLQQNRIQTVPEDFLGLKLDALTLEGNPLQKHELFKNTPEERTMSLLRKNRISLQRSDNLQKGLRVLVVGKCGSGKTSLVEAFTEGKCISLVDEKQHEHTIGIRRYFKSINMETGGKREDCVQELSIWDFAGEKTYSMMNQIFQTDGTLIWLVVNLEEYERVPNYHEHIGVWIRTLVARLVKPVVWVVCTHADKIIPNMVELKCRDIHETVCDDCKVLIKENMERSQINHHCISHSDGLTFLRENLEVVAVSNTHGFSGISELERKLQILLQKSAFSFLTTELPNKWVRAEALLREHSVFLLKNSQPPVITEGEAHRLLEKILPVEKISQFIKFLHQNGEILLFTFGGCTKIFLDVLWLINVLQQIFRHDLKEYLEDLPAREKYNVTPTCIQLNKEWSHAGMLGKALLEKLWSVVGIDDKCFNDITALLQQFGLAYGEFETPDTSPNKVYLFPWLLQEGQSHSRPNIVSDHSHETIRYDFGHIPLGLFDCLIVHCLKHLEHKKVHRNVLIAFHRIQRTSVHIMFTPTREYGGQIDLWCFSSSRCCTHFNVCETLKLLCKEFDKLLQDWPGLIFCDKARLCHQCVEQNATNIGVTQFSLDSLLYKKLCGDCSRQNEITEEPVAATTSSFSTEPRPKRPKLSSSITDTEDALGDADLFDIKCYLLNLDKTHIYNLGLALGLSQRRVKMMRDSDTFIDDVLAAWLHREDDVEKRGVPTWKTLVKVLNHRLLGQTGIAGDICRDKGIQSSC